MGMFVDRYLGLSEDLVSGALPKGAINGILIDNPSGSWLLVEPIHLFVPPYISGWTNPMPNVFSVTVRWVDSPSGSKSTAVLPTGQKVHVHLDSDTYPHSDGFTSGAGGRVSIIPPFLSAFILVQSNEGGSGTFGMSIPNGPIVLRRITAVGGFNTPGGAVALSASVELGYFTLSQPWSLDQAISPEAPFAESVLEDGAYRINVNAIAGDTLNVVASTEQGGGKQFVKITAQYYPEVASV